MSEVDPVFVWLARLALALLFATAALHKARDLPAFTATLRDYRILPKVTAAAAALALVIFELAVVALLLLPAAGPMGPLAVLLLLALYSGAIGLNLARGRRHIDCGCLGPADRQPISPWLLVRNAAVALGPLLLLLSSETPRPGSWIDGVSVLGGVTLLALLWNAVHQLATAQTALRAPGRAS
jgi:hypothetical protein